jgi:ATP-dependent DNA helicase DinG
MHSKLSEEARDFLSHSVASSMESYEPRDSQLRMMDACASLIEGGGTLVAEAGTGTGKTFAYLVPIILSGEKAIVSTRTINLQEQLASKDLKLLSGLKDFAYAVAKGRGNYLCLRRLHAFHPDGAEEAEEHKGMLDWAAGTASGDIEEYRDYRRPLIWEKVCADADACKGKKCGHFGKCFYFLARQGWEAAGVVVTNHALLAINAMMPDDRKILPKAGVLVVDEGHALDSVISEQIGLILSDRGFDKVLNELLRVDQRGVYKGLLSKAPVLFQDVEALRVETGVFFNRVRASAENRRLIKGTFELDGAIRELASSVRSLLEKIRTSAIGLFSEDEELDLKAAVIRLRSLAEGMEIFPEESEGFVRWAEIEERRTGLRMAPIYPSEFVRTNLLPGYGSVILTSATLSVGGDFGLTEDVLGLDEPETLSVPSPFDIRSQVQICVERGIDLKREGGTERRAGHLCSSPRAR